jgi:4-amino-4-deoxy-L-arabinose transferase-like glycosyltransferase
MEPVDASITQKTWTYWLDKWFVWLAATGILVNASGLLLPILEPDGALYATIAKNMAISGDFINLMVEGTDWLDKPHFPFWITAISFKVFGINSFAYKFPALLFWLAGIYYTYAFAFKLYNRQTAHLAVLIYLSIEHLIISNNDVRAEPYLTGLMIGAAYYYYRVYTEKKLVYCILGSLLLAMAVMTKGIFVAVMVFAGFIIHWIIKKKWNEFINYRWWLSIVLLLAFIMPELITLYMQFDLHPEKPVFGRTNVSGVRFFFWDSQFGRFFNTGPIKGKGDPFFYVHTLLWAFLPWSIILFTLVFTKLKNFRQIIQPEENYICEGIALTGFLIFSLSRFQLPHYLNILYPFFSIIVAAYLINLKSTGLVKTIIYSQNTLYILFFVLCTALAFFFGLPGQWLTMGILLLLAVVIYRIVPAHSVQDAIGRSFIAVMVVNIFLNGLFYPALFKYQSGYVAASYLKKQGYKEPVYMFNGLPSEYAFQFYYDQPVIKINTGQPDTMKNGVLVYIPRQQTDTLQATGYTVDVIQKFPHFHISQLTGAFINHKTREKTLEYFILARLTQNAERLTLNAKRVTRNAKE